MERRRAWREREECGRQDGWMEEASHQIRLGLEGRGNELGFIMDVVGEAAAAAYQFCAW